MAKQYVGLKIEEEMLNQIKARSEENGNNISEEIRLLLNKALNEDQTSSNAPSTEGLTRVLSSLDRELEAKNRQIDGLTEALDREQQLNGLAQKNIALLTEQLSDTRQALEDRLHRRWYHALMWWKG